ncbi:MAG: AAA family ATPase, partial [Kiritimatiellae bacterium]|nr:AAA family ATPase [Kiritimatiellia bacterium]
MLSRLSVRNLAVVEAAEIHFAQGLNVITGETGAGKSVLMGALRLLQGVRADRTIIRAGAEETTVSALYELPDTTAIDACLADADLPSCEDGILILRRTLRADGTGRVRINDAPATATTLRKLAPLLIDIHGPDDNLTLLDAKFQLQLLIAYANATPAYRAYVQQWQTLQALKDELEALVGNPEQREAELTRLRETLADIAAVNPTLDDGDLLTEQHAQAANAELILETGNQILAGLTEGDNALAEQLVAQHRLLHTLTQLLPEAAEWSEELDAIQTQLQSLSSALSMRLSQIDTDPAALAQLEARLGQIQRLRRRYGPTLEEVLRHRDETQARLNALADAEAVVYKLEEQIAKAEAALLICGRTLRKQ